MSVDVAVGYPQYAGMDIRYIPQKFAPKMVYDFYQKAVTPAMTNQNYESMAASGDSVIIRKRPKGVVSKYVKGQGWGNVDVPHAEPITMPLDQANVYTFDVNEVDEKQADIVLSPEFLAGVKQEQVVYVDKVFFAAIALLAGAKNSGSGAGNDSGTLELGTLADPILVNHHNALEVYTRISLAFDEYSVDEDQRGVAIPPWFRRMLIMTKKLSSASIMGDDVSVLRNGRIGTIERLTAYMTRNLPVTNGVTQIVAMHKSAVTFATQLLSNKVMPNPAGPAGTRYSGIQVFGFMAVLPIGLITMCVAPDPADASLYATDEG